MIRIVTDGLNCRTVQLMPDYLETPWRRRWGIGRWW